MLVTGTPSQVDIFLWPGCTLLYVRAMPLGYFVQANGRTGARLRVARGTHELVATGPAARLGTLIPHYTTTTTITADGRPLEVRLPFLLALWLVLGCLVPSDDVVDLFVFHYIVGAERLGSALDVLLDSIDIDATSLVTHLPFCAACFWSSAPRCALRTLCLLPSPLPASFSWEGLLMTWSAVIWLCPCIRLQSSRPGLG